MLQEFEAMEQGDRKSLDQLSVETVLQDSSLAEGAAGLLAMTSTADRTKQLQVDCPHAGCILLHLAYAGCILRHLAYAGCVLPITLGYSVMCCDVSRM